MWKEYHTTIKETEVNLHTPMEKYHDIFKGKVTEYILIPFFFKQLYKYVYT
jgi:hypothetical protein